MRNKHSSMRNKHNTIRQTKSNSTIRQPNTIRQQSKVQQFKLLQMHSIPSLETILTTVTSCILVCGICSLNRNSNLGNDNRSNSNARQKVHHNGKNRKGSCKRARRFEIRKATKPNEAVEAPTKKNHDGCSVIIQTSRSRIVIVGYWLGRTVRWSIRLLGSLISIH